MSIRIYFGNKPLILQEDKNPNTVNHITEKETVFSDSVAQEEIERILSELKRAEIKAGLIVFNPNKSLQAVSQYFQVIEAAGGFVHDGSDHILLIFRKGKWDLPKGKLDEGEELEQCAVREVEEETGLKNIELKQKLCVTYHTYFQDGADILKPSHWYMMQSDRSQVLTPQVNEDIEECKWVKAEEIATYMQNTHPSISDVVTQGLQQLKSLHGRNQAIN